MHPEANVVVAAAAAGVSDATAVVSSHLAVVVAGLCFAVGSDSFPGTTLLDYFQVLRLLGYFKSISSPF